MPITKWHTEPAQLVSPALFSKSGYEGTELNDAINASLSSVIVQLSCIARHSEMMFAELVQESQAICDRTKNLSGRVDALKQHVLQLNPVFEEGMS